MQRILALIALLPIAALAGPAADVAREIRETSFDREECYRVRDLTLTVEDIRLYLTDGHLIFSKPVGGRRIAAVFTADTTGGEGEVILMPPNRAERKSLARYTESPNLDERLQSAMMIFTGDIYAQLKKQIDESASSRKLPELGPVMEQQWNPVLRNIVASYEPRVALDLLGGSKTPGLFAAIVSGANLGNFDVLFDPTGAEQILAGKVAERDGRLYFDTWTAFEARSFRNKPDTADFKIEDYRIDATVHPDLAMSVVTKVKVTPAQDGVTAVPFEISPRMEVTAVTVDGRPAEVLQREALRANILRSGNELFLVAPDAPLRAGQQYEFEFRHSGRIISAGDDRIFYVAARAEWYPTQRLQFSNFDLTFRYPRGLTLVTAGDLVDDRTEGEQRITRRRTPSPVCVVGFNLGDYAHERISKAGFTVDVYANHTLEAALKPPPRIVPEMPVVVDPRRMDPVRQPVLVLPSEAPSPAEKLRELAGEVASALEFMAARFGPPVLPSLTVSPISGNFGQGFSGLVYLSTMSYLKKQPSGMAGREAERQYFFQDILQAHETAHQWWGNRVVPRAYRDYWLMEALANYSALLYVDKRRGGKVLDRILNEYRDSLLEHTEDGQTIESIGPIALGARLESSIEPRAYRTITYNKGSWIIHMLRMQMGDERFFAMLAELSRRYDRKRVSTEEFRALASRFMPAGSDDPTLEYFFEQWVYGTGVPDFKMNYSVKGKPGAYKLAGTIQQSNVANDFTALVPVQVEIVRGRFTTQWVRTGKDDSQFTVSLKQKPLKVTLDPNRAVLRK